MLNGCVNPFVRRFEVIHALTSPQALKLSRAEKPVDDLNA
jgi:hypothetical protein